MTHGCSWPRQAAAAHAVVAILTSCDRDAVWKGECGVPDKSLDFVTAAMRRSMLWHLAGVGSHAAVHPWLTSAND